MNKILEKLRAVNLKDIIWVWKNIKNLKFELILMSAVISFVSFLEVYTSVIMKELVEHAIIAKALKEIFPDITKIILLYVFLVVVGSVRSMWSISLTERMKMQIRSKAFASVIRSEWTFFSQYHSGDIVTRLTSDVNVVTDFVFTVFLDIPSLIITFVSAFAILFSFNPKLTYFVVILVPFTAVVVRIISKKLYKLTMQIQKTESKFRSFLQESLANITVVKAFRMENSSAGTLDKIHKERLTLVKKRNKLSVASNLTLTFSFYIAYFIALIWGISSIITTKISYGVFTALLQLVNKVQSPIFGMVRILPTVISAFASIKRIREISDVTVEKFNDDLSCKSNMGISLTDVDFSYINTNIASSNNPENSEENEPQGEQVIEVLKNINMSITQGEYTGLIGLSGAGKTTLIRLLLAFTYPQKGKVNFICEDGKIYEASTDTRSIISYVPQGNTLISGTIAENLRLVKADATNEEMYETLRCACAEDFVLKLKDKLDTRIGEKGVGLSEGQAQRIALARAILYDKPILILDEATSALDLETEKQFFENLKKSDKARTYIIISHKGYALNLCNTVYRIENGSIFKDK